MAIRVFLTEDDRSVTQSKRWLVLDSRQWLEGVLCRSTKSKGDLHGAGRSASRQFAHPNKPRSLRRPRFEVPGAVTHRRRSQLAIAGAGSTWALGFQTLPVSGRPPVTANPMAHSLRCFSFQFPPDISVRTEMLGSRP